MGLPKCMIDIDGQTILSRLIHLLRPHVPRIHVVIGYREEIIAEYCARHFRDVVLVRNPDFRTTNTSHSLRLGSIGLHDKILYLDGDLLIDEESMSGFISRATQVPILVGITHAKSSQAVFAITHETSEGLLEIVSFDRDRPSPFEWGNVFVGPPAILKPGTGYVFESLADHLPIPAHELQLFEVDTTADLQRAQEGIACINTRND